MNDQNVLLATAALALLAGVALAAGGKLPLKTGATLDNLQAAYSGEVNTKAKYEAYSARASAEGYLGAASLFNAAAFAESVHATQFARAIAALGGEPKASVKVHIAGGTVENLADALSGELFETGKLYPAFLKRAKDDNNDLARFSFGGAIAAERSHAGYFDKALSDPPGWRGRRKFLVCGICGYATLDTKLKTCPASSSPRKKFVEVH